MKHLQSFEFETLKLNAQGEEVRRYTKTGQCYLAELGTNGHLEMVSIPAGTFLMGSDEAEGDADERPQHEVTLKSFFISKFLITQAQWRVVAQLPKINMDLFAAPAYFPGDQLPVEQVTWAEAREFCARLAAHSQQAYTLPSESQWEYACRAGTQTAFAFGENISSQISNYDGGCPYLDAPQEISRSRTLIVGELGVANEFGLYDMHGNVWEWCLDVWHDNYEGAPTDGSAWLQGGQPALRVVRGGSWDYPAYGCRAAFRDRANPTIRSPFNGLRVVINL